MRRSVPMRKVAVGVPLIILILPSERASTLRLSFVATDMGTLIVALSISARKVNNVSLLALGAANTVARRIVPTSALGLSVKTDTAASVARPIRLVVRTDR
eukprot:GILJ01003595.1.p2 GENE.GILJ01003595.1~~GILJ01003595.1.p2  ORF type:complete len:101 (-),score=12.11 GILJ01003595.1:418-720(-)